MEQTTNQPRQPHRYFQLQHNLNWKDFPLSPTEVANLLVTAVEGGSTYWCKGLEELGGGPLGPSERVDYSSVLPSDWDFQKGGFYERLVIHCRTYLVSTCEDGDKVAAVNLMSIMRAIEKCAKRQGRLVERFYEEHDADTADMVLQEACFGQVVYG